MNDNNLEIFKEIEEDFLRNFDDVCGNQATDLENIYYARENITNFFDLIKNFIESKNDRTTQKGIALEIVTDSSWYDFPFCLNCFFESPIEYLMFTALQKTMPFHISQQAYLLPQVEVCNKKYRLDICLMKRALTRGHDGNKLLIGIECDGYEFHYSDKTKASETASRIREIKMIENIEVIQYTGSEIYANAINLANQFWKHVENKIFPEFGQSEIYSYDSIYEMVKEYLNCPNYVKDFYVYEYEHIDVLDFMLSSDAVLCKYDGYNEMIKEIKNRLLEKGWEGDGEIQLLWFPPFCNLPYEDTYGVVTWIVKQENNGTSFICSPFELNYKSLYLK